MSNQQKENKNKLLELAAEQSKNDKIPTGTGSGSGLKKVIFEALETVQKKKPESMISVPEIMEEIHKALPEARATRKTSYLNWQLSNLKMTKFQREPVLVLD